MTMNALVTGAYGFIGRHVARALSARGYRVTGMGHGAWDRKEWRSWGIDEWHLTDVNLETLGIYAGEPDIIAHCAGSGSVSYSVTHPLQDYRRTVDTAMAVLEYIRTAAPSARLVVPSSAAVYGLVETMPITLQSPLSPVSPYGVHKRIVEELCCSYATHFGLKVALVRLFSVYGIGLRKQLLWDACVKLAAGDLSFMGTGRETRDLLHVEDAAQLLLTAAEQASDKCPIVNGGTGQTVEIRMILEEIASALGKSHGLSFSGKARAGDPLHYQAGITEALALGWQPARHWQTEVQTYVDWFKEGAA